MAVDQAEVPWRVLASVAKKPEPTAGKPANPNCGKTYDSTSCRKEWRNGLPCTGCPNRH